MEVVTGIAVGVTTVVVILAAFVTVGFVILFRRRGDRGVRAVSAHSVGELDKRAGTLLVKMDDALRDADNELGYAIAQFGATSAKNYGDALATARTKVTEAFRLRQALDDSRPDTEREKRQWTLQIVALCEQADAVLAEQDAAFGALRGLEVNAASTLTDLRSRISAGHARLPDARASLATLAATYAPETLSPVAGNAVAAENELSAASAVADTAAQGVSQSGVSSVSGTLQQALQGAYRADQLLDAIERASADLASASAALTTLRAKAATDVAEARAQATSAPDADTGSAILDAIVAVETAVKAALPADPVRALDCIGDAVSGLDLALASARNQAQRLEHARAAYAGTLVSARNQIQTARELIGHAGGGVDARTRLAEAERQLMLAENETDPVDALDTIRRAVTHARDADALARYDAMGHR